MFDTSVDNSATGISSIANPVIIAVSGSNNNPEKKQANEYLLKKNSDNGSDKSEAEMFADKNSLR